MKTLPIIMLISLIPIIQGWVAIGTTDKEKLKDHPDDQCYYAPIGYMKAKEEKTNPSSCEKILCHENGRITIEGCSARHDPSCLTNARDASKPYPECCDQICPKN
ncbi:hypothetical protein WA026_016936 [Henosepilachna vigintioctopunctata]|uniref:Single domain-containing protein n=1 Tax=Henosepilachna vigintioctopunctata TaxID=420089 RepID=A0AAW1U953_9CUCU